MAGLPLMLQACRDRTTPARVLVLGLANCCDLIKFIRHYFPAVTVDAVDCGTGLRQLAADLAADFGLPLECCRGLDSSHLTLGAAAGAVAASSPAAYDVVWIDLAAEAGGRPVAEVLTPELVANVAAGLRPAGVFCVGAGEGVAAAEAVRPCFSGTALQQLAVVQDGGARESVETAEAVLIATKHSGPKPADRLTADEWASAVSDGRWSGVVGASHGPALPMKVLWVSGAPTHLQPPLGVPRMSVRPPLALPRC